MVTYLHLKRNISHSYLYTSNFDSFLAPDEESVSALDFSQVEDDDNMFGLFLRGIHNPRVEFPEEECPQEEVIHIEQTPIPISNLL